nr:glutathione S-transferase isoform II, GST II {internal fragment 2} {EC 2.5.1.18} [Zea mays=maize, seedling roots, Peptide Partial, 12 aa] [Zea mays]
VYGWAISPFVSR